MRQAGRYLPEYRELRAEAGSFLDSLLRSAPRRRGDAAADPALRVRRRDPVLGHPRRAARARAGRALRRGRRAAARSGDLARRSCAGSPRRCRSSAWRRCSRRSTASRVRCPPETTLLGFCGAPWTVASYMIAGKGTPDQAPARLLAYRDPAFMLSAHRPARRGLDRLSDRRRSTPARRRCRSSRASGRRCRRRCSSRSRSIRSGRSCKG